jgi:hypothetical protein
MMAKGTYGHINLATKDLDGTFERLQGSVAEVVQEPIEQPYGSRLRRPRSRGQPDPHHRTALSPPALSATTYTDATVTPAAEIAHSSAILVDG